MPEHRDTAIEDKDEGKDEGADFYRELMEGRQLSRRHHTNPEFCLNRFTAPPPNRSGIPGFWIYSRGQSEPRWGTPHNTSVRKDYNSYELPNGELTDFPEAFLARLDDLVAPLFGRIVQHPEAITRDDLHTLAVFVAAMAARSPKQREHSTQKATARWKERLLERLQDEAEMEQLLKRFREETGRGQTLTIERVRRGIEEGRVLLKLGQHGQIGYSLGGILPLAEWLDTLRWAVLKAPAGREFVTSDALVVIDASGPRDEAFGMPTKDVQVTYPLDPEHCLWMTSGGPVGPLLAQRGQVEDIVRQRWKLTGRFTRAART